MKTIAKLLKTSNKVVKDECDDPCIFGKTGKVYTDLTYWYLYLVGAKRWNKAKEELSFMYVWQDGDSEGVLRADFPPSPKQAVLIRKYVGLGKKRVMSPEQASILKKHMFKPRSQTPETLP